MTTEMAAANAAAFASAAPVVWVAAAWEGVFPVAGSAHRAAVVRPAATNRAP